MDLRNAQVRNDIGISLEYDIDRCLEKNLNYYQNRKWVLNCMYHADQIEKSAFIDGMLLVLSQYYTDTTKNLIDNFIEENNFYFYRGKHFHEIGLDNVEKIYDGFERLIKLCKEIHI